MSVVFVVVVVGVVVVGVVVTLFWSPYDFSERLKI